MRHQRNLVFSPFGEAFPNPVIRAPAWSDCSASGAALAGFAGSLQTGALAQQGSHHLVLLADPSGAGRA